MPKDAKGHGSNPRGYLANASDARAHDALRQVVKAGRPGSQRSANAESVLKTNYGYTDRDIAGLKSTERNAAGALAQGHPKSSTVPVHPAMGGPSEKFVRGYPSAPRTPIPSKAKTSSEKYINRGR